MQDARNFAKKLAKELYRSICENTDVALPEATVLYMSSFTSWSCRCNHCLNREQWTMPRRQRELSGSSCQQIDATLLLLSLRFPSILPA